MDALNIGAIEWLISTLTVQVKKIPTLIIGTLFFSFWGSGGRPVTCQPAKCLFIAVDLCELKKCVFIKEKEAQTSKGRLHQLSTRLASRVPEIHFGADYKPQWGFAVSQAWRGNRVNLLDLFQNDPNNHIQATHNALFENLLKEFFDVKDEQSSGVWWVVNLLNNTFPRR